MAPKIGWCEPNSRTQYSNEKCTSVKLDFVTTLRAIQATDLVISKSFSDDTFLKANAVGLCVLEEILRDRKIKLLE